MRTRGERAVLPSHMDHRRFLDRGDRLERLSPMGWRLSAWRSPFRAHYERSNGPVFPVPVKRRNLKAATLARHLCCKPIARTVGSEIRMKRSPRSRDTWHSTPNVSIRSPSPFDDSWSPRIVSELRVSGCAIVIARQGRHIFRPTQPSRQRTIDP